MQKTKTKNFNKFIVVVSTLVFAISFSIPFLSYYNVNAKSSTFIQQNDYTIGMCGFNGTAIDYRDDETYCSLASMPFLSFNGNDIQSVKISFNEFNGDLPIYHTYNLNKVTASKYQLIGSVSIGFYALNEYNNKVDPYSEQGIINLTCTQIDFYCLTTNNSLTEFYDRVACVDGYTYGSYPNVKKLYVFKDSNYNRVGELYLTFPKLVRVAGDNDYIVSDDVIKIDRSEYIKTEVIREEIIVDEINDYRSFFTVVKNGVMSFFGVTLFGDFTVGHIIALVLSFVGFKFLLHIIAK